MTAIQLPTTHWVAGYVDPKNPVDGGSVALLDANGNPVPEMAQFIVTANNNETDPYVMWVYCAAWWPSAVGLTDANAYKNPAQTIEQAMAAYNARSKNIDAKWLQYIAHAQMYFTGDTPFRPGSPWAHVDTLQSALRQWGIDAASPGYLDAIVNAGPLIVLGAAAAGAAGMFDSFSATGAGAGAYIEPGSILSDTGAAGVTSASTVANIGAETATLPATVTSASTVLPTLSTASPLASTASLLKQFAGLYSLVSASSSPQRTYVRNPGVPAVTNHAALNDHLNQVIGASPTIRTATNAPIDNQTASWQGSAKILIPLALAALAFLR